MYRNIVKFTKNLYLFLRLSHATVWTKKYDFTYADVTRKKSNTRVRREGKFHDARMQLSSFDFVRDSRDSSIPG